MTDILIILFHFFKARYLAQAFKTRQELEIWQKKKIAFFIKNNLSNSLFYQKYLGKNLSEFPLINKKLMIENFDQINTQNLKIDQVLAIAKQAEKTRNFLPMIGEISVGLSSGTSGQTGIFIAKKSERLKWAGIMLAKALPQNILKKYKIAFFLRANNNLYETLKKNRLIEFNFFDLSKNFSQHLENLDRYQPNILVAPSTILKYIALAQEQKKININPEKIFAAAEVLEEFDQKFIEEIFKQKLQQIYQCCEGFLAITDAKGNLRLNEEYLHIEKEWLDKKSGRFVPIITDFNRVSQPVIRYRLDDVLIEDFSINSPFTYLKKIEGRFDDICYLKNQNGESTPLFADILRNIFATNLNNFDEYKIIQNSISEFEIQIKPEINESDKTLIYKAWQSFCFEQKCQMPNLIFSKYQQPKFDQKLKRIENKINFYEKNFNHRN
ncbi:MAG: hypothetical protein SFV53_00860 [Rickettsiales bacterium]|nr:hypothetical protein [Rickettsiales bacterium]